MSILTVSKEYRFASLYRDGQKTHDRGLKRETGTSKLGCWDRERHFRVTELKTSSKINLNFPSVHHSSVLNYY